MSNVLKTAEKVFQKYPKVFKSAKRSKYKGKRKRSTIKKQKVTEKF